MVTSAYPDAASSATCPALRHYWLAEAVRLRESQWGPLQDSSEVRRVRAQGGSFVQRLLSRAQLLGQREGLDVLIRQWAGWARIALFLLAGAALMAGIGGAMGALGDGHRPVNLLLALATLLGLHALTLLFWGISLFMPSVPSHNNLGQAWLWLTQKLAQGPQAALVPRALTELLSRQNALRPLLGSISHGLWLCALTAMLVVLITLLSARRYTFNWETTLLAPDTFVWLAGWLGTIPSLLGFATPSDAIVRLSDGLHTLPDSAHALWSSWLIGCLVCYGLAPRVLALLVTLFITRQRMAHITLDPSLPGYLELRDRLEPPSQHGGIDAPAPDTQDVPDMAQHSVLAISQDQAIMGLELASDLPWPPAALAPSVTDLGIVDSRTQRQRVLDALQTGAPQKLLIVCDGAQTPDRGTLALLRELAQLAAHTHIALLSPALPIPDPATGASTDHRRGIWQARLQDIGIASESIHTHPDDALAWLHDTAMHARNNAPKVTP